MPTDFHLRYNPEPSKLLTQYGEVTTGSYFAGQGMLYLASNDPIECQFEVAHMRDGSCWAVAYLDYPTKTPFLTEQLYMREAEQAKNLVGTDRFSRRHVEISNLRSIGWKYSRANYSGFRLVFVVGEYFASLSPVPEPNHKVEVYHLANIVMSMNFSPEETLKADESKFHEELERTILQSALEAVISARSSDINDEKLIQLGLQKAETIKIELLENSPQVFRRGIAFTFRDKIIANLYWIKETPEYPSDPLVALRIITNNAPERQNDNIAEWICALLSVAIGRMVVWNYSYLAPLEMWDSKPKERWSSRKLQLIKFNGLTEKGGQLNRFGLNDNSDTVNFVQECLAYVLETPSSTTANYLETLNDYVYYASTTDDKQHRCTLLCVLVEKLISTWEDLENPNIEDEFTRAQRHLIIDSVEREIATSISEILVQERDETDANYEIRKGQFLERLRSTISTNLKQSFANRLKWLFRYYGWKTNTILPYATIEKSVDSFVKTRNKLFHEHRFYSDDVNKVPDEQIRLKNIVSEIKNVEVFVPLTLATILHYRGRYWDEHRNMWDSIPRESTNVAGEGDEEERGEDGAGGEHGGDSGELGDDAREGRAER